MGEPVATVTASRPGVVSDLDPLALGLAAVALGAGRARKEDAVDPKAGFVVHRRPGEPVAEGDTLATIYASDPSRADPAAVRAAFTVSDAAPEPGALVLDRFSGEGWRGSAG